MKKYLLLLLVFSTFVIESKAQYQPLMGDSTKWCLMWNFIVVRSGERMLENRYEAYGDTTIGSTTYKNVYADGNHFGALREDSVNKKVYFVYTGESAEELLYDFNLDMGDTLNIDLHNNPSNNLQDGDYIVDSVGTVNTLGGVRKYIRLHNPNNTNTGPNGKPLKLEWVESVGDIYLPFYLYMYDDFGIGIPNWNCGFEGMCEVINHEIDGEKNYINVCALTNPNGYVHDDSCQVDYMGSVAQLEGKHFKLSVYPNPSNGKSISVSVPSDTYFAGQMVLDITELNGKKILSRTVKAPGNVLTIDQLNLKTGMYLVSLRQDNILLGVGKVVVE